MSAQGTWTSPGSSTNRAPGMSSGDVAALVDPRVEIAGPVEHERRALHAGQHVSNVDLRVHQDEIAGTGRAERRARHAMEPGAFGGVGAREASSRGRRSRPSSPPCPSQPHALAPTSAPTGSRRSHALRVGAVEDERTRALRIRRGEQSAHRPALRVAEERGPLTSDCVHDRPHVVHSRLEIGEPDASIRKPRPALVEADQPREGSEPVGGTARARGAPSGSRGARRIPRRARGRAARRR